MIRDTGWIRSDRFLDLGQTSLGEEEDEKTQVCDYEQVSYGRNAKAETGKRGLGWLRRSAAACIETMSKPVAGLRKALRMFARALRGSGLRKALRMFARPPRGSGSARRPVVIELYRGFGRQGDVFLTGRVFRQPVFGLERRYGSVLGDIEELLRRFFRWGLAGKLLKLRVQGHETVVRTGPRGWFSARLQPTRLDPDSLWQDVEVELEKPHTKARGILFAPAQPPRFVVVSDIDDTVMETGVGQTLRMLWHLFFSEAKTRTLFPGVASFYRALHVGPAGTDTNPMLYVSRGPWGLYPLLEEFFRTHRIPIGPVVFLRDWGLSLQHLLPVRAKEHKQRLIETMLSVYRDCPFILIGDSGQKDPEIYAELALRHPGRIGVIYIRDVSRRALRSASMRRLADSIGPSGTRLVIAEDSSIMARDAALRGLISNDAVQDVCMSQARL